MWLDELDELRDVLRRRINDHYAALAGSESTVRYALVNPLLTALGWDLEDPSRVRTEYRVDQFPQKDGKLTLGFLDYVLMQDQQRLLVVEAKALGKPLDDERVDQCIRYCHRYGPGHFVVTNGRQWQGYYLFAQGGTSENQDFVFDMDDSPTMDLLWLWPGNFRTDRRARPVPKPRREVSEEQTAIAPSLPSAQPSAATTSGVPLSDVNYEPGMSNPRRLIFPDGKTKDVTKSWASVQPATAEWLIDDGYVKGLPLRNRQGTYLLHKEPKKKTGKPFRKDSAREVRKNHWIDMNFGPKGHLTKAMELLESCEVDPATVYLELT